VIEGRPERVSAGPRWPIARTLLLWFGVFGAPAAWTILLVLGYGFEEVDCSRGSKDWSFDSWNANLALFIATAVVAAAAVASSVWSWRAAQRSEAADVRGRLTWMAFSGVLIGCLFFALILFTGVGITALDPCRYG
jgi:hypothetical protein